MPFVMALQVCDHSCPTNSFGEQVYSRRLARTGYRVQYQGQVRKAGHKSLRLFKRRFEGHFDLICRHLYKCLGETLCLLPNSLHLRLHKLGLYSKRVLKVLRPTQLLINAWVAAMFFSA
jgi:hypothetical protein